MKIFKPHKYVQPEGDKNCIIYNIANIFNVPLDYLDLYKVKGIGTKDMEYIIKKMGYPDSYVAVMSNITQVPGTNFEVLRDDLLKFIIESIKQYCTKEDYIVIPLVVRLKNKALHSVFLLANKDRYVISDPRKTHMVEVSLEELLSAIKCEQIAVLLKYKEFRKSYPIYISI